MSIVMKIKSFLGINADSMIKPIVKSINKLEKYQSSLEKQIEDTKIKSTTAVLKCSSVLSEIEEAEEYSLKEIDKTIDNFLDSMANEATKVKEVTEEKAKVAVDKEKKIVKKCAEELESAEYELERAKMYHSNIQGLLSK